MRSPKHPRRPPRIEPFANRQPFYFVTFNTYKRLPLLARREVHDAFRNFCLRAEDHEIAVGRYALMPDHVHLFVFIPEHGDTALEKWIQSLRAVVGKTLLRLGIEKPHWQEGFFDHLLRSSESYGEKWEYVRMNPVRAGLSKTSEEWPYQGEIMRLPFE